MSMTRDDGNRAAGDEVDFVRLISLVIRYRWFIIGICASAVLFFVALQLRQLPVFSSQATVRIDCSLARQAVGGRSYRLVTKFLSIEEWRGLLQDRSWTIEMVRKRGVAPLVGELLARQQGDADVSAEQAADILRRILKVIPDGQDTMTLRLEGAEPAPVAKILEAYVSELGESVEKDFPENRGRALATLESERRYMIRQLSGTGDRAIKDKLAEAIVSVIGNEAVLRNPEFAGFQVVLPPTHPEKMVPPKQWLRAIFVAGLAFLMGVLLVLVYERLKNVRLRGVLRSLPPTT